MLLGSNEELPSDEAAITVFHSLPPFLGIGNAINLDMAYAFREFPRRDGDLCDGGRERGVKTVVARLHDVVRHDIGVAGGDLLVTVFLGHTAHDSDSADTRRRLAAGWSFARRGPATLAAPALRIKLVHGAKPVPNIFLKPKLSICGGTNRLREFSGLHHSINGAPTNPYNFDNLFLVKQAPPARRRLLRRRVLRCGFIKHFRSLSPRLKLRGRSRCGGNVLVVPDER